MMQLIKALAKSSKITLLLRLRMLTIQLSGEGKFGYYLHYYYLV
jgi:hypothetical protein